ncbi:MAG: DUF167 domain-containing protein [Candidatus Omnitrophota bacterium]|nr:MAG: DUF167 domain-containing protein [Candidatus Omnitrophota bacterium]
MIVNVRVVPRARKERIEEFYGGLKVYLNEPAEEGKANKKLIKVLAGFFRVKKSNIKILKGLKSRQKVIQISETT